MPGEVAIEMFDALVVENLRNTARPDEYGHAVAEDERSRMIDLEASPARQHNRERLERRALLEGSQGLIEIVRGHFSFFALGFVASV
jgi:hypothetical protein